MPRTTTGCVTCRIRHVKCDEGKPACQRCLSTGRTCDGYIEGRLRRPREERSLIPTYRRTPGPVLMPRICPWRDEQEAYTFEFFRYRTAAASKMLLGSTFWDGLILERTHHAEYIKHIVLALGAYHRSHESGDTSGRAYAWSHHQEAIRHTREAITEASFSGSCSNNIMIAVILFHCLEYATGNFQGAQTHLKAGMRLLRERKAAAIETSLVDAMHRLDFHASTMSDISAPYEPAETADNLAFKVEAYHTVEQALSYLIRLAKWCTTSSFNAIEDRDLKAEAFGSQREACKTEMCMWKAYFDNLQLKGSPQSTTVDLLEIYYTLNWLILTCYSTGTETAWDAGLASWKHIVSLCNNMIDSRTYKDQSTTIPKFSFEMGLIVPLFMTGLKCRDPVLRRKAITLLQSQHWREGVWESTWAARVLETVIQQEEVGLDSISKAENIPEMNRVIMVQSSISYEMRSLDLNMHMRSFDRDAKGAIIKRLVRI